MFRKPKRGVETRKMRTSSAGKVSEVVTQLVVGKIGIC